MTPATFLPDDVIEAIVSDRRVAPPYTRLVDIADDVRSLGAGPAPGPSAELAALLRGNGDAEVGVTPAADGMRTGGVVPRRSSLVAKVAGLGIVAKVALGTSIAAAGVVGAGASGVLPEGAEDVVRSAVEAISPFEIDEGSTEGPARSGDPETGADGVGSGESESTDTRGGSGDDQRPESNGVDEPPGQTGDTGLTRANETPAEPHAPETTPGPPTTAAHPTPSSTVPAWRPDDPGRPAGPPAVPGATAGARDD